MNDRDEEILRRLSNIESQVASIDETTAFTMRSNRDAHREELKRIFGTSKRRAQVYLVANGTRTVGDIATHLSMKLPNVSTELTKLEEAGLLRPSSSGSVKYWSKKPLDWALGASDLLMTLFSLRPDGTARS